MHACILIVGLRAHVSCLLVCMCRLLNKIYLILSYLILKPSADWDFETAIEGPWMKKWELTHLNRHTDKVSNDVSIGWHNMTKA